MAETPEDLTEYERRRLENIKRNEAILSQLRRDAADLSAAFAKPRPRKQPRATPTIPYGPPRRSGRTRLQTPSSSEAASLPSAPLKPRSTHFSITDVFVGQTVTDTSAPLTSAILAASWPPLEGKVRAGAELDPGMELVLKPGDVRKLAKTLIAAVRVLPLADRTVVAAGTTTGNLVFWDADSPAVPARADAVFRYRPHTGFVGGITAHPSAPRKIYSCTHDGDICVMDVEKEIFSTIHLCDYSAFSLCQAPDHATSLYFGEGNGELKAFDARVGKISSKWRLHGDCIISIDFNPADSYMMATSSLDKKACLWDLRNMKMQKPEKMKVVEHKDCVNSAYFSPGGNFLATTSHDDTVGILNIHNFNISCFHQHICHSTTFKANWGWNDSDLLLATQRDIKIISVDLKDDKISTSCKGCIESEHLTEAPSQFSVQPYRVGHLACIGRNKVFLWTPKQNG